MTTVVYLESVLTPHLRRVESRHGSIQVLAPDWQIPYVAFLDGKPVLRADWELVPEDNQSLAFIEISALPQGGGGGGSTFSCSSSTCSTFTLSIRTISVLGFSPISSAITAARCKPTTKINPENREAKLFFE